MKTISIIAGAAVLAGAAGLRRCRALTGRHGKPRADAAGAAGAAAPLLPRRAASLDGAGAAHLRAGGQARRAGGGECLCPLGRAGAGQSASSTIPCSAQLFGDARRCASACSRALGSGVIVRADGLILTNNHVVEGGTDIVVALSDKREFKAKVLLADPRTDLAVLKIDTKGERLPVVPFADSDRGAGGRPGAGDRRSLRRRPDRDHGHRLGAGPHPDFRQRLSVLHPDRRRHQSGQFRRRAGHHRRQAGRHQHRHLFAQRRQYRHRLRHSRQSGAPGGGRRGRRPKSGTPPA